MDKFWISHTDYIDIETGEIIDEKKFKENYTKIETTKKSYVRSAKYGTIKYQTTGRKKPKQLGIW